MTMNERTAWAHLVTVIVTSGVYPALMVTLMAAGPVATIGWVGPMLWTIGSSVVGTIAGTIAGPITATVARSITSARLSPRGGAPSPIVEIDTVSDARDREIDLRAGRALVGVLGAGFVGPGAGDAWRRHVRVTNRIRVLGVEAAEMTPAELARRIGVTRPTAIAIERGRSSPSLDLAFQTANVFDHRARRGPHR